MAKEITRETFVRKFFKDNQLPFPVARENFLKYYATIKGYEDILGDFSRYIDYVEKIGYNQYFKGRDVLISTVIKTIKENPKYQEFNKSPIQPKEYNKINNKKNIYTDENIGKKFISFDVIKGNYTVLQKIGAVPNQSYEEYLATFTDDEFILYSKNSRQYMLGQLTNKRIANYLKNMTFDNIMEAEKYLSKEFIRWYSEDEVVYEYSEVSKEILKKLQEIFKEYRIDIFELGKTEHGYVKIYEDKPETFHCINKKYFLEDYKKYKGLELNPLDYCFLTEDRKLSVRLE